jgi:hypothetical protein
MRWLRNLCWRFVQSRVDALVTERLVMFEEALVKREQIRRSYPPEPPRAQLQETTACWAGSTAG